MVTRALRAALMLVALLAALPAFAARAQLSIDTKRLEVGQEVGLKVTIVGASATATPRVAAPDGLQITYVSRATTQQSINGRVTWYTQYHYAVAAAREGRYTIGPVEVEIGTDRLRTEPITVEVVAPQPADASSPLSVSAKFEPEAAYEGQVVIYRYRLEARGPILHKNWTLPTFEGLLPPRDGAPQEDTFTIQDPDGVITVVEGYVPLVATGTGQRDQRGAVVKIELPDDSGRRTRSPFGLFAPTRSEVAVSEPAKLSVRPLPPAPEGYNGLVGDFVVEARLTRAEVAVGGSVGVHVEITGDGALEGFQLPPMPVLERARVYDESPAVGAAVVDGRYQARGVFSRVVVPTSEGRLELPPLRVVAFSPTQGRYVTHEIPLPAVEVAAGEAGRAEVASFARPGEAVTDDAPEDIRPIRAPSRARAWTLGAAAPVLVALSALPGAGIVGASALAWWRARPRRQPAPVEVTPRERLARLPGDPKARLSELDAALRDALARRAGVPVARLDREAAMAALDATLRERVRDATRALDRARFAEQAPDPGLEAAVRELVVSLEPA